MFFHDPFGSSQSDSLYNFHGDAKESSYIYFFDQEPLHLDFHDPTFLEVVRRNTDISWPNRTPGAIVTSEKDSEFVQQICDRYQWDHFYYFFHGWAALDWFRGYNRSFLMPDPASRVIRHSFFSPNRIVSGQRLHRSILMYHLLRNGINSAQISFPAVCPYSRRSVIDETQILTTLYPDISSVLSKAALPWNFVGESGHPMHSYQLSLFDQCARSMCYVVTETVWQGQRQHLTEKIFKPICLHMPFVLVGTAGSLAYLRSYGFKTFADLWDENYDLELDDHKRLKKISNLLLWFDSLDQTSLQRLYQTAQPILQHNHEHFYGGGFESLLWQELSVMLSSLPKDSHCC
jgi:hypothetical protein